MSVTVKELNKIAINRTQINEVAKAQLSTIDKKISNAALNGLNEITYTLPITFMSGVTSDRNILLVYVKIIQSLESRGFAVKYNPETETPYINITWEIEEDVSVNQKIVEFLDART